MSPQEPIVWRLARHDNRRIYCKALKRHLRLEEILAQYLEGRDIVIIDRGTKLDISAETLLRAVALQVARGELVVPPDRLRACISELMKEIKT